VNTAPRALRELLPQGSIFDDAASRRSSLLWFWALAEAVRTHSPHLEHAFSFTAWDDAVALRHGGQYWLVGSPRRICTFLQSLAPNPLSAPSRARCYWLDHEVWLDPALDPLRPSLSSEIGHALRLTHPPQLSLLRPHPDCGPVQRHELSQLRALDRSQFGHPLSFDSDALLSAGVIWVARQGTRLAACVRFTCFPQSRLCLLSSLWTDVSHRRRGLARRLIQTILAHCQAKQWSCALNVERSNQAALALYQQLGFSNAGEAALLSTPGD
jgi:ribosomal protein S18 acetylase RimI-like enzyme